MLANIGWKAIDQNLRSIARRRSALDAEEARWLRDAMRCEVWKKLGMVSALDYCERVLHYTPKVARDRLRVARALANLPKIEAAFAAGDLSYTHVRELSRIAIADTDEVWCAAATGCTVAEVQRQVANREVGDRPTDPQKPEARRYRIELEVSAEVFARYQETARRLSQDAGMRLDDDQLIASLCDAADAPRGASMSPKHAIGVVICERCNQAWQDGGGKRVAISASSFEKAACDAVDVGRVDGTEPPRRAVADVTPRVRRFVWARDEGRCQAPGCRSSLGLEIHHLEHRADGGKHDAVNLTLRCSAHHGVHHDGRDDRLAMLHSALRNRGWPSAAIDEALAAIAPHLGHRLFGELLEEVLHR